LNGLREEAIDAGKPEDIPPALLERPEVPEHCAWYIDAFYTLSPSRQIGWGPGGILLVEMLAYCQVFGVSDAERFVRTMQALDALYLEHQTKKTAS
jgi:hypothetical protein